MGIDARMFVRVPNGTYTNDSLRPIAAQMCAMLGHENFYLQDGSASWHEKGGRHALSLESRTVGSYLEDNRDWLKAANIRTLEAYPAHRLLYSQDGPPVVADENEQIILVHLWSRYYGEGYARGDWPLLRQVGEFLESRFAGCAVFYGGDSSGVLAELFDAKRREEINRFFLTAGHGSYRGYFKDFGGRAHPKCDFCGGRPMNSVGGGGLASFFSCDGCGRKEIVLPSGRHVLEKDEDFFEANRRLAAG